MPKYSRQRDRRRHLSTSTSLSAPETTARQPAISNAAQESSPIQSYTSSLAKPFRIVKIFSLFSLSLSFTLTPLLFILESSLPPIARVSFALTAVGVSAGSTGLIGVAGGRYVVAARRRAAGGEGGGRGDILELTTKSIILRTRQTRIYDPTPGLFLVPSNKAFTTYELATSVVLPTSSTTNNGGGDGEETIAECFSAKGDVLGRWIVSWEKDGRTGTCRGVGNIPRYYNIPPPILASLTSHSSNSPPINP